MAFCTFKKKNINENYYLWRDDVEWLSVWIFYPRFNDIFIHIYTRRNTITFEILLAMVWQNGRRHTGLLSLPQMGGGGLYFVAREGGSGCVKARGWGCCCCVLSNSRTTFTCRLPTKKIIMSCIYTFYRRTLHYILYLFLILSNRLSSSKKNKSKNKSSIKIQLE